VAPDCFFVVIDHATPSAAINRLSASVQLDHTSTGSVEATAGIGFVASALGLRPRTCG
jgi:hypothetical protein